MREMDWMWEVPTDLPAFAGHFPGNAIVPGVVLLDQALYRAQMLSGHEDIFLQVAQAKFLSPVRPGELLRFEFEITSRSNIRFDISASDRAVASGIFSPQTT